MNLPPTTSPPPTRETTSAGPRPYESASAAASTCRAGAQASRTNPSAAPAPAPAPARASNPAQTAPARRGTSPSPSSSSRDARRGGALWNCNSFRSRLARASRRLAAADARPLCAGGNLTTKDTLIERLTNRGARGPRATGPTGAAGGGGGGYLGISSFFQPMLEYAFWRRSTVSSCLCHGYDPNCAAMRLRETSRRAARSVFATFRAGFPAAASLASKLTRSHESKVRLEASSGSWS
mmetsp:Transcript_8613/g.29554  ORF Transcript_8613/g.29554 Transcript_8613/m.29554 type:complete len:238 (-) Transcript_8613:1767-2480(-)